MKKRIYKATKVKHLNLENLKKAVEGKDIVLSVDVAKEAFMAVIMGKDKKTIITISWKHPVESQLFFDIILKELPWSSLEVAMEPSGTYGDFLRTYFQEQGITVYRVSPKRCHDASEVFDGVPSSHDAKASAIIGWLHLDGSSEIWPKQTDDQRKLGAAIKSMELHDDTFYRYINKLEGLTMRYWPELTQHLKLQSATLLELLMKYGCPENVVQDIEQAKRLMIKTGGPMLKGTKIEKVLESAKNSLGVKCIEEEREQLQELCNEIRMLQKLCRQAQLKIEKLTKHIDCVREMTPVIGKVTAAILYMAIGDVKEYDNAGSIVKTLGLNLKERSSGKHKGLLRITKRGSGSARMYLYMAVLRLIQRDSIIKAWYLQKVSRDGGIKKKALVAIMRKLASALWYVGQGSKFDASKLFDVNRLDVCAVSAGAR